VCDRVDVVDNTVGITILQHPGERRHAFNSARLAAAVLRNASLHVLWLDRARRLRFTRPLPAHTALLYPRDDATDLADLDPVDHPRHLVVLDGTWSQARRLYRDNPQLADLPHVQLTPARPSRYRIRAEPAPHCLSTIEAIALALSVLEPGTPGLGRMLDGFLAMVDDQAEHIARGRTLRPCPPESP
jgi:DTW domain-containing protein YfiP